MDNEIGSPIKGFVKSFLDGLESGLAEKGYVTCQEDNCHAKMELITIATSEKGIEGGAKILNIGGKAHFNGLDKKITENNSFC